MRNCQSQVLILVVVEYDIVVYKDEWDCENDVDVLILVVVEYDIVVYMGVLPSIHIRMS